MKRLSKKNGLRISLFVSIILSSLLLFGCNNSKVSAETTAQEVTETKTSKSSSTKPVEMKLSGSLVSYDSMVEFFKPNYSSELPDSKTEAGKAAKNNGDKNKKDNKQTTSAIPGIRKLSEYKTQYTSQRKEIPSYSIEETNTSTPDEEEDFSYKIFEIEDWGPQGTIVSEMANPTFYVLFSQPVRTLTALDKPTDTSDIMKITPALKGQFRWFGTQHLCFEASEQPDPSVVYTISVDDQLTSIYGHKITGTTTFQTKAQEVQIKNLYGGYIKDYDVAYNNYTGALPPYENRFFIRTNYQLKADSIAKKLDIRVNNTKLWYDEGDYSVETSYNPKTFSYWNNKPEYDEEKQVSNSFVITINSPVPHNATVTVKSQDNSKTFTYYTLKKFTITDFSSYAGYADGNKGNPVTIRFSQTPDLDSLANNLSLKNIDYTITKDNFEAYGTTVKVHSLPLEMSQSYTLVLGPEIVDIYGQKLTGNQTAYNFKTPAAKAYINYLNYGAKMMEAQYPHKLIFEHQNLENNSYYQVREFGNPLYTSSKNLAHVEETIINPGTPNTRHFEEIDLDPYLTNGYGFVRFDAKAFLEKYDYWDEKKYIDTESNTLTVQVTDLGITSRIGINRAVVMVRSLSTNKPVENATVYILSNVENQAIDLLDYQIAQGKTDKNGLAVINFTEEEINKYTSKIKYSYEDYVSVYVVNGDDKAVFTPKSHNSYRSGVSTNYRYTARKPIQRTFMFVDRGIYRPGEIVTFRGIDKDQLLGELVTHTGNYSISVEGAWWNSEEITERINGSLSESGGFYGSFKLPDDLEPGSYRITYKRNEGNNNSSEYIYFKVAEFERVKTTAGITVPEITYFGGDTLSAELWAEYLAGGVLSGADYSTSWYKQPVTFYPSTAETKNYSFGPNTYGDRNYISNTRGKLSGDGKANLSCNSEKITDGNTYMYRVEADITDVSNQRISTSANIMVHPAIFYIGVKPSKTGFAKTKEKLDFNFILTDTKGNLLTSPAKKVSSLSYKLVREEWTMVHEQSVDNTIYTRYEKQDIEESSGTFAVTDKGTLSITPENSGWYTLTLTGKDNKGNIVLTTYDFYVTGGNNFRYNDYDSESINLTPDQSKYNPGDTAKILMESPLPAGDYLITVEREGIFTEEIKHFDSPANVIEVPVATNYVPVVYVSVSSYSVRNGEPTHQYGEPDLDKPKGYYGVTPVFVDPYVRAFSISVETDKPTYRPGEEVTLNLTATKGGKAFANAELTVMAVDRGVLDLIDYHVPNPIDYFYSTYNFPLRVKGGDSRAMLMDPVTYSIKDLQGGDSDEEKEDERKDFRPTALFEPVVTTDKNGKATVKFTLPDSLTTYRITVFGVKDSQFALQEDEFAVQNPINVQQVQPRKLRERDTAECGVLITNLDGTGHEITVSLETRTPTKNTAQDELEGRITVPGQAFVDGPSSHKIYVASGASSVVYFDVGAEKSGTVELVYTIESDILNEKLNSPIKIEKTYCYETVAILGSINDDMDDVKVKEQLAVPGFAKDGQGNLSFTLDATRLGMLGSSVNYLFDYPYGCMEQQSSRVLPLIIFGDYIDVFGLDSKVMNVKNCVTSYTKTWGKYQLEGGGFPYWPNDPIPSLYVSIRLAHIYSLAMERGYSSEDFSYDIKALANYINSSLHETRNKPSDYLCAYGSYVLALLGDNRCDDIITYINRKIDDVNLSTEVLTGLYYNALGQKDRAKSIANHVRQYLQPDGRGVSVLRKTVSNMWEWYNSDSEEMALILQLLTLMNPDDSMVDRLVYSLLNEQSHGYWKNTASTAKVLEAIYTFIQGRNLDATDFTAKINLNGKDIMSSTFVGAAAKPETVKMDFEKAALPTDKAVPVIVEKNGTGNLYYTMEMKYALPDEMQAARDEGVKITYKIIDSETDELVNPENSTDSTLKLTSGKIYKASITIEAPKRRYYLAVRAPIPSGCEILDSSLITGKTSESSSSYSWGNWCSNKTIHDNEIQFFWDTFYSGTSTVNFTFRASRRGIYPVPPVQAECMYEPEIFGRGDGYLTIIE